MPGQSVARRVRRAGLAAQRARRATEKVAEGFVEPADAAEPRGQCHLRHRQMGIVQELLCEQHATGLGDGNGRGAEVTLEQSAKLPGADPQAIRQPLDVGLLAIERAFGNQRQGATDRVGAAAPKGEVGRDLRPAAQARPEAGLLGRRRRRVEATILETRHASRAYRPAVYLGRGDADEDAAIEAGIVALEGAVIRFAVEQFHRSSFPCGSGRCSRFSDLCIGQGVAGSIPFSGGYAQFLASGM